MTFQYRHQTRIPYAATEPAQGIEDGQIGFSSACVIDALTVGYPGISMVNARKKRTNQRRLADSWLAPPINTS